MLSGRIPGALPRAMLSQPFGLKTVGYAGRLVGEWTYAARGNVEYPVTCSAIHATHADQFR
jgi:hypothetical protein